MNSYDLIAEEYYSARHITSRNFDEATKHALDDFPIPLPTKGLVLEFGAGRGRSKEFLSIESNRIIQTDSSIKMLSLRDREESLLRVNCDARSTPFLSSQFSVCAAFLCDPYWGLEFLREAFRLTEPNGYFLATMPAYGWGIPLRNKLGLEQDTTIFVSVNDESISVPSRLVPPAIIAAQLEQVGFRRDRIKISSWKLPTSVKSVSPHLTISANAQNMSPYELEIIDLVLARK